MRVTEQIDALVTLSTNPIKYLVTPRIIAATLALPILVAVAGQHRDHGRLSGRGRVGWTSTRPSYLQQHHANSCNVVDITSGLWKAAAFGFIIALMGCYHGYPLRARRPGRRPGDDATPSSPPAC